MKTTISLITIAGLAAAANAQLINEFEPNPAGGDPAQQQVELSGQAGSSFDLWLLSIENDDQSSRGTVDRASNVSGVFDSNGLAVVTIDDLENPSNTLILSDAFTGSVGVDYDVANDGNLDTSAFGNVLDAVGVSDDAGDDALLYASGLGGTDILFNGQFEPLFVFRELSTGDWYQGVTVDFGDPTERLGVFAAFGGPEISPDAFTPSASTTFGADNPLIPAPASAALLGLGGLAAVRRRR